MLTEKKLKIAIQLANNKTNQPQTFAGTGGNNTVTLDGHRASLRVQNSGGLAGSEAQLSIWGLSQSIQDQLSTLGMVIQLVPRNTITIDAGDDKQGMSTVFIGVIVQAVPDYTSIPDEPFRFELNSIAAVLAAPLAASSYKGATDVATILQSLAEKSGWKFENNGVTVNLASPYLSGTAIDQIRKVADAADINYAVMNGVLAIWPRYGIRKGAGKPMVSPQTGMIGYPNYTQQGIKISTLFNPQIIMGGQIEVKSSLKRATGTWNVGKVDLALDQAVPKGQWMTTAWCYNPNFPKPLPSQTG